VTYTPNVNFEDFENEYLINQPSISDVNLPALIDTTGLSPILAQVLRAGVSEKGDLCFKQINQFMLKGIR
jgi:hypothetical protein